MSRFIAMIASLIALSSQSASAALGCEEFLAMETSHQQIFVSGLVDGMGTTLGVMDTFSRHLTTRAQTQEEKTGIENMHQLPKGFLSKGCCLENEVVVEKIIKGCEAKIDRPVGNMLTDVMSGEL